MSGNTIHEFLTPAMYKSLFPVNLQHFGGIFRHPGYFNAKPGTFELLRWVNMTLYS